MGFLRKLFGRGEEPYRDTRGVYFYVECDRCGDRVRLRADKQYDLNRTESGYSWHKTIIDNRCFRPMPTVVHLNSNYEVVTAEIEGGHFISQEEFETPVVTEVESEEEE